VVLLCCPSAEAKIVGLALSPGQPAAAPVLGEQINLVAMDDGTSAMPTVVSWTWCVVYGPNQSTLYGFNGSATSLSIPANTPGYYVFTASIVYPPWAGQQNAVFSFSFGVPPANQLAATGPPPTPTNVWVAFLLRWQLWSGASPCGSMISGNAEENLTDQMYADGSTPPDSGFQPGLAPSPNFQLLEGQIWDYWYCGEIAPWNYIAAGGMIWSCDQELQIVWTMVRADTRLVEIINPLPTVSIYESKVDADDFQVNACVWN
jgi:hypothetical protein